MLMSQDEQKSVSSTDDADKAIEQPIRCLHDVERIQLNGGEVPAHLHHELRVEHEIVRYAMEHWAAMEAAGLSPQEIRSSDYRAMLEAGQSLSRLAPYGTSLRASDLITHLERTSSRFRTPDGRNSIKRLFGQDPVSQEMAFEVLLPELRARQELRAWGTLADAFAKRANAAMDPLSLKQSWLSQAQAMATKIDAGIKFGDPSEDALQWQTVANTGGIVPTGFREIDEPTGGGLSRGDLMVVGGGTGHGKSYCAWKMMRNQAESGRAVLYVSVEDSKELMLCRMLADYASPALSPVDIRTAMHGANRRVDPRQINDAARRLQQQQKGLVTTLNAQKWTLSQICTAIRQARYTKQIDMVIVDYLQAIQSDDPSDDNRVQITARCVNELKKTCGEVGVALVLMSQYARDDYRDGAEPGLNACKYAGDIENEAEVMLLLWRDVESNLMGKVAKLKWASAYGRRYSIATNPVSGAFMDWHKVEDDPQAKDAATNRGGKGQRGGRR